MKIPIVLVATLLLFSRVTAFPALDAEESGFGDSGSGESDIQVMDTPQGEIAGFTLAILFCVGAFLYGIGWLIGCAKKGDPNSLCWSPETIRDFFTSPFRTNRGQGNERGVTEV